MSMTDHNQKKIRWHFLYLSILLWIAVISWMVLIFMLSSEPGHVSAMRSSETTELLNRYLGTDFSDFFVRKMAHVVEYSILTFLSYSAFACTFRIFIKNAIIKRSSTDIKDGFQINALLSIWITVLFAAIDEYHQVFVPGRSGSVLDLFINISAGIAVLIVLKVLFVIARLIMSLKKPEDD